MAITPPPIAGCPATFPDRDGNPASRSVPRAVHLGRTAPVDAGPRSAGGLRQVVPGVVA